MRRYAPVVSPQLPQVASVSPSPVPRGSRLAAFCFLLIMLGAAPRAVAGNPERYALVIGANHGSGEDAALRYAVSDAHAVAEVLVKLGDFLPDNIVVLEDPDANRARDALARLNARMRVEMPTPDRGFLLVFYSGHGDADAMHLGETPLPWDELRNATVGSSAGVRLLVVDACRSGAVTRVKGFEVAPPFDVGQGPAPPEGFALVSSAAAGESAQEADSIGGSFFTHHLLVGLQGAADKNHDDTVTLSEAYEYAAARTRASTVATLGGVQHPTYAYGLKGYTDLVVTRLTAAKDWGALHMTHPAQYLVWRGGANGTLSAEAAVDKGGATLRLPAGTYFVQERLERHLFEGTVNVRAGHVAEVDPTELREVAYAQWVRKGGDRDATAYAFTLWSGLGSQPLGLTGYQPQVPVNLMTTIQFPQLSVDVLLGGAYADTRNNPLNARMWSAHIAAGVRKMYDIGPIALGFGARPGLSMWWQSFDTTRIAPSRSVLVPQLDTLVRLDWHPAASLIVGVEATLRVSAFHQAPTDTLKFPVEGLGQVGVGWQW